jgi:hypothetical protein
LSATTYLIAVVTTEPTFANAAVQAGLIVGVLAAEQGLKVIVPFELTV